MKGAVEQKKLNWKNPIENLYSNMRRRSCGENMGSPWGNSFGTALRIKRIAKAGPIFDNIIECLRKNREG